MLTRRPEPVVAGLLVAVLGTATVAAIGGVLSSALVPAVIAGALGAVALTALVATDWLDGLLLAILAVPLPALFSNGSVRIAAAAPVTALVVFAWLLRGGPRDIGRTRFPVRTGAALLLAFALATVFAAAPATSLREFVNIAVLAAFLVLATDQLHADESRVDLAVGLLATVAGCVGVFALLETVGILPGQFPRGALGYNRAALGFGQPNGLGLFLAVSAPLVLHVVRTTRGFARAAAAAALGATLVGLVCTFSRGSWLALLGGSGILLFARAGRTVLRIQLFAIAFIVLVDVATGGILRDTAARTVGDWVIEQRLALQLAGVLMFLDNPILGVGPGGYAVALDRYGAQIPQLFDYLPTPHNAYVQMAAETGIVGLIAFVLFLGAGLIAGVRAARSAPPHRRGLRLSLLWSFATMCAAGLVVWPFAHGTGQAVLVVGAAAFAAPLEDP